MIIIWLALRAGKMDQISHCDWLPKRARWSYFACSGYGLCPARKIYHVLAFYPIYSCNKSFIDQACLVKIAGYWPSSFFACLWTSTSSRSINMQKKNLANIQPSWPHAWSITHIYCAAKAVLAASLSCFWVWMGCAYPVVRMWLSWFHVLLLTEIICVLLFGFRLLHL